MSIVNAYDPPEMAVHVFGERLPLTYGHSMWDRIDLITVEPGNRFEFMLWVQQGIPDTLVEPPPVPDGHRLLARVTVPAGAVMIEPSDIEEQT